MVGLERHEPTSGPSRQLYEPTLEVESIYGLYRLLLLLNYLKLQLLWTSSLCSAQLSISQRQCV